jgi:hypothetical protein
MAFYMDYWFKCCSGSNEVLIFTCAANGAQTLYADSEVYDPVQSHRCPIDTVQMQMSSQLPEDVDCGLRSG